MTLEELSIKLKETKITKEETLKARELLAPMGRGVDFPHEYLKDARKAAVLALFYEENQKVFLLLIERKKYRGVHSGQIAFPGGSLDEKDKTLQDTALRETMEETGLNPGKIEILRTLEDLYIPPSNFLVRPFVGIYHNRAIFRPDPTEVEEIVPVSLDDLMDCRVTLKKVKTGNGLFMKVPCFVLNQKIVWGATGILISELRYLLKNSRSSSKFSI